MDLKEFLCLLGLINSLETVKKTERDALWAKEDVGYYKTYDYGRYMTRNRFYNILKHLKVSKSANKFDQILDFITVVNQQAKKAVSAGNILVEDESMLKAYHKDLIAKKKMPRKPTPVGNELKDIADAKSKIVLHLELQQEKEQQQTLEYTDLFAAF